MSRVILCHWSPTRYAYARVPSLGYDDCSCRIAPPPGVAMYEGELAALKYWQDVEIASALSDAVKLAELEECAPPGYGACLASANAKLGGVPMTRPIVKLCTQARSVNGWRPWVRFLGGALAALALASCTSATEAEIGTRLRELGIKAAAISCVGTLDAPGTNHGVCNVRMPDGQVQVVHCDFMWPSAGCVIVRPGGGQ